MAGYGIRLEMLSETRVQGRSGRSAGENECTVCLKGKKCMSEAVARPIEAIQGRKPCMDGPSGLASCEGSPAGTIEPAKHMPGHPL